MRFTRQIMIFFALVIVLVILTILPFYVIILLNGIPFSNRAEPTYVNGLITANGIFLGVILSTATSKGKGFGFGGVIFLLLPTMVFFVAMYMVFGNMIRNNVTISDLALLATSLLFSIVFVWVFLYEQFEEKKAVSQNGHRLTTYTQTKQ
jgi:hypothetical protein